MAAEENQLFAVLVRVHAHTEDLHFDWVAETLGIDHEDPTISSVWVDEDEGVSGIRFGKGLPSNRNKEMWPRPELLAATKWLQTRAPEQFRRIREAGLQVDVCIAAYSGWIPAEFTKELARLNLDLMLISKPDG